MSMAKSIECKSCGNVYSSTEEKCPYCGAVNIEREAPVAQNPQPQPQYQQQPQQQYQQPQPQVIYVQQPAQPQGNLGKGPLDKTTAILLCLFLGFFGAHKFYEGKMGAGILYLFTGGIFFFGVFFDLIALLGKPSKYYV